LYKVEVATSFWGISVVRAENWRSSPTQGPKYTSTYKFPGVGSHNDSLSHHSVFMEQEAGAARSRVAGGSNPAIAQETAFTLHKGLNVSR
jgi:hypothetical protein